MGGTIRAILFDLDDTLLDTHGASAAALNATCVLAAEHCPGLAEAAIRDAFREVIHATDRALELGRISFASAPELHRYRWRETLARCGGSPEHAAALGDCYAAARRAAHRLYPEVAEVLPGLLRVYQVALLTNGPADFQREKIAAIELGRWIGTYFISGELGFWKPYPQIFEHALTELGRRPGEVVMVGDSLRHDIAGAAAVGLRTVWVNRHGWASSTEVRPDAEIADLRALAGVVQRWRRGP